MFTEVSYRNLKCCKQSLIDNSGEDTADWNIDSKEDSKDAQEVSDRH
jgi:hypothetical protein